MSKTSKNFKVFALILLTAAILVVATCPNIAYVKAQTTDSVYVYTSLGGSITGNGTTLTGGASASYANGTAVSFEAVAGTGFNFLCFEYAASTGAVTYTTNPLVVTLTSSSCAIEAMFTPASNVTPVATSGTSTIDVLTSLGGTTNPSSGSYTNYTIGTADDFVATPGTGFTFLYWMVSAAAGSCISTTSTIDYNVSASTCALQAYFIPTGSSVTLPSTSPTPTTTVNEFSSATAIIASVMLVAVAFGTYTYTKKAKK